MSCVSPFHQHILLFGFNSTSRIDPVSPSIPFSADSQETRASGGDETAKALRGNSRKVN